MEFNGRAADETLLTTQTELDNNIVHKIQNSKRNNKTKNKTFCRRLAVETFKNIQRTPTTTLEDILVVFRRNYVEHESSASAKPKFN